MEIQDKTQVTIVKGTGNRYQWVAITSLLLAIGAILRIVTPSVAGISLNWNIAMYCLAIILIRPSLSKAAGIGLVAGTIALITSKSAFPYANLVSDLVGAVLCAAIVNIKAELKIGKMNIMPAVCGLLCTLASGFVFVTIVKVALSLPMNVYLYGMLPVVATVAAVNTFITQLLYFPAYKIFTKGEEHERS